LGGGTNSIAEIRFAILREENEKLKEELKRFKELEDQVLQLETENAEKSAAAKEYEVLKTNFKTQIKQLEERAEAAESKHEDLESSLKTATERTGQLEVELEAKDEALATLESDLQVLFHQKEDQSMELMKTLDSYKERYSEAVSARAVQEKRLQDLVAIEQKLRLGQEKQQQLVQNLHRATGLLQEKSEAILEAHQTIGSLTTQLAEAKLQKEAAVAQIEELKGQLVAVDQKLNESEVAHTTSPFTSDLVCCDSKSEAVPLDLDVREEVKEVVEDLVWAVREIQYRTESKIQMHNKDLEIFGYIDEIDVLKEAIVAKTSEMEQLQEYSSQEIEAYQEDVKALQEKLHGTREKLKMQEEQSESDGPSQNTLKETLSFCQELQQTITIKEGELQEAKAEAKQRGLDAQRLKADADACSKKMRKELEIKELCNADLQEKIQHLENALEKAERLGNQQASDYKQQYQTFKASIHQLEERSATLQREVKAAQSLRQTQALNKENKGEVERLKATLAIQEARCVKLKEDSVLMKKYLVLRGLSSNPLTDTTSPVGLKL